MLKEAILAHIQQNGAMPVSAYIALCNAHYYATRDPLGASGDFTTAPEISQMFGEIVGFWAASILMELGGGALALVELGPGRGTLMSDALRALKIIPNLAPRLSVHLVETSPALREKQALTLFNSGIIPQWHETIDSLPDKPMVVIANEFFDALPIEQWIKIGANEKDWQERTIISKGGQLAFNDPAPNLPLFEKSPLSQAILEDLSHKMMRSGGAALIIDYGHTKTALGETLQAMRQHRFTNLLENCGDCDLTAHVDFAALKETAQSCGLSVPDIITQGEFLSRLGIHQRAEKLKQNATPQQRETINQSLERLLDPSPIGMGQLFKAMALAHPALPPLAGFEQ